MARKQFKLPSFLCIFYSITRFYFHTIIYWPQLSSPTYMINAWETQAGDTKRTLIINSEHVYMIFTSICHIGSVFALHMYSLSDIGELRVHYLNIDMLMSSFILKSCFSHSAQQLTWHMGVNINVNVLRIKMIQVWYFLRNLLSPCSDELKRFGRTTLRSEGT